MINTIACTPSEAIEVINALWDLKYSIILWGPPGVGKSQLTYQLALARAMRLIDIRLSQKVASDIGGLPALDHETKRTTFYLPDFLPTDETPTIVFLDELSGADEHTRIASYGLILERKVGNYTLPDSARIICASNRLEDGGISCDFGTAMNDRLIHIVIEPSAKDWLQWAVENDIRKEVMAFIQVRQDYLTATPEMRQNNHAILPTPRSWERVSRVFETVKVRRLREIAINGIIGDVVAHEFLTMAEELANMASVETILQTHRLNLHSVIPNTVNGLYGMAYALAAALTKPNLERIMEVIDALDELKGNKHDGLPMADVQALAGSVVLERALKLKLDCSEMPAFISFDSKRRRDAPALERAA